MKEKVGKIRMKETASCFFYNSTDPLTIFEPQNPAINVFEVVEWRIFVL